MRYRLTALQVGQLTGTKMVAWPRLPRVNCWAVRWYSSARSRPQSRHTVDSLTCGLGAGPRDDLQQLTAILYHAGTNRRSGRTDQRPVRLPRLYSTAYCTQHGRHHDCTPDRVSQ
jgi:hypothetical protein